MAEIYSQVKYTRSTSKHKDVTDNTSASHHSYRHKSHFTSKLSYKPNANRMHSFDTQDSDTALLGIDSFASILVLHPCCPQQLQVSFHVAEGLLQSFLPLLQRSPSSSEAPIHVNILLRAEVATRNHQRPQPLLRWEEDGPIRMETRACVTR